MAKAKRHVHVVSEPSNAARYDELKKMLLERQRELKSEVHGKIRDIRSDSNEREHEGSTGDGESCVDIQEDIEFALIEMKARTLEKIDEALVRLDDGTYGNCRDCGDEIAQPRLRALPFVVRCKDCEELDEIARQREGRSRAYQEGTLGA